MDRGKPNRRSVALISVMAAGILGGCSTAPPRGQLPDTHVEAETPPAFVDFCARFPGQCISRPGAVSRLAFDEPTLQQLAAVNHAVNAAIKAQNDKAHYGRDEFWTIPADGLGDCEDYALTKRKELLDAGLPVAAVRLAVVYSAKTALHAVLTVSTDKGDLVLDNMSDAILPWDFTGFTWIMVQDPSNPLRWNSLRPASAHRGGTASNARVSVTNLLTDPDGK